MYSLAWNSYIVKQPNGFYNYKGATFPHVKLIKDNWAEM
jgi:hypothetical protein